MSQPKVARTPVDIAASVGAHAFMAWLDVIPTVANPHRTEAEHERAEQLAQLLDDQIAVIQRERCRGETPQQDEGAP